MKKYLILLIIPVVMAACSPQRQLPYIEGKLETQAEDEYEVLVFDTGFENWFASVWNPAKDRSNNYYKSWNDQYVAAWNYKVIHPGYSDFFTNQINYDPGTNYGLQVNRKLFYYFMWVEERLGIPILEGPGPSVM